ncbi:30S ribosomal protein S8 [Buchnera aphidicola (Cinara tujafilina)]|uniref:Small ribosomal subunit protein uS8 n=1 Tax=Buchnera aphidicola (Cinara tujafilina) TaxID=261317 RepID=F7WZN6_9GAMM|nr:30S ribosomal protein S8 [Buchnera aphidicola]AEH39903.1 30S ribosomal protein S8 [Buchnera aphidicola (Cinara tujafilina)]
MSIQDPISDMITCIRNGQRANKISITIPFSKLKKNITKVLKSEGYIINYHIYKKTYQVLEIVLKYFKGKPVIENISRVSRPGLRQYCKKKDLPLIMQGLGIAIISTSCGILTDRVARIKNLGGEIICYVE